MALVGDNLYRKIRTKQDEAVELDQQLTRMEDDIRRPKI